MIRYITERSASPSKTEQCPSTAHRTGGWCRFRVRRRPLPTSDFDKKSAFSYPKKMPKLLRLNRRRSARVRTSSNMGVCVSQFKAPNNEKTIVRVEQGLLEGEMLKTPSGVRCDVFLGVPYAKPPIGELRFKKPVPPESWQGVRKCNKYPNRSIHKEMPWDKALPSAPMSEDCLYLNVFAPRVREDKKYPVLFYVHGGGWMMDSAERYTAKNICRLLVSREIIVVTMHYRLGFLGFLCTGDEASPGNYGMFDVLEALKWTHANISSFGGDPANITISGQSAGSASADLLSISPLARGLFKNKIVMGGNSFCHWAVTKKADIREYCKKNARRLGWKPQSSYPSKIDESHDLVNFFKQLPASKLGSTMFFCKTFFGECQLPLAPVIDGDLLPKNLKALRAEAPSVPTIVGGGEYESLLFCAIGLLRGTEKEIDNAISVLCKKSGLSRAKVEEITHKLYGDSAAVRASSKLRKRFYVEMLSDIFANYGNYRYMKESREKAADCYAYSFDHQSKQLWGWLQHVVPFTGGTHTSDVSYLFDCNYMAAPLGMNKKDKAISEMTADYFTNFVKFGTPNALDANDSHQLATWEPIAKNGDKLEQFCIKIEPEMKAKQYIDRMERLEECLSAIYEAENEDEKCPSILQLQITDIKSNS
ncbi:unnamed protein product [Caenorhabditis bovis]|uniref:Carboxylic ester hydrolase n=1 Tax=Caenorhabditis bovis TaxID=2654633 RepID=A0A8S1DZR3_9PELO|nr:unnamed protein product [Caenorhabditis bovis]